MATILREWSYRYAWLYEIVSRTAALSVGGIDRLRRLAVDGIALPSGSRVLDLCCGSGQETQILVDRGWSVVGLDASPRAIARAQANVPQAAFITAFAEAMPFGDREFDLVVTNAAMHEMTPPQLQQIVTEVFRVLKPGGTFALVDFHRPTHPLVWPLVAAFLWLFETDTSWQFIATDAIALLRNAGFVACDRVLHAGGSLQVLRAQKPGEQ